MALKKPKSTLPTLKAEKKRSDILKSATKCFRKTGFHQTSMQEICTETALGPGAVYRYFPSKDAIIEAMADAERSEARAMLGELGETENFSDVVHYIGKLLSERYKASAEAGLMMEVYAEGLRNKRVGACVRKTENDWLDGLAALVRKAQQRGQVDPTLEPRHTALLLTAMWDGMIIRHAYHPADRTPALGAFFNAMATKLLAADGVVVDKVKAKLKPEIKIPSKTKVSTPPAVKIEKRSKPVVKLPPMTASLFDDEPVYENVKKDEEAEAPEEVAETDARQMSLI
jgi:TetR/AcrR family transcriptional repressor of uid operon